MSPGRRLPIRIVRAGGDLCRPAFEDGLNQCVVVDSQDRVYIHNRSERQRRRVFDREATFLASWGESFGGAPRDVVPTGKQDGEFLYFARPGAAPGMQRPARRRRSVCGWPVPEQTRHL